MKLSLARPLRNRYLFVSDLILLAVAVYFSYVLRLETLDLAGYWPGFLLFTGLALVIIPLVFLRVGVYAPLLALCVCRGDGAVGRLADHLGSTDCRAQFGDCLPCARRPNVPRSISFIFLLLALVATAGPRSADAFVARSTINRRNDKGSACAAATGADHGRGRRRRHDRARTEEQSRTWDWSRSASWTTIWASTTCASTAFRCWATVTPFPEMVAAYKVRLVIIAMPTAPGKEIRDIVGICGEAGVQARIIPGMYELLGGSVSVNQLRDVQIEDLLRRAPVQIDAAQVATLVRGKRVLVTGAGGSIGSELCRQIARLDPAELVLLGHGENSIFDIHNELKGAGSRAKDAPSTFDLEPSTIHPVIADVRDADRLHAVLEQYRPEVVFHAAAHKHVPLMESNEVEAVTNNVLGTRNLVRAALQAGVTHFVLISTDKAVNPSSVMGATKRIAELIVQQAARQSGQGFVAVRFGNVLGSRGSVIPFFQKQIAAGGPVTVTHPEMRRYFMTIPEAVQLVLQAAALGHGGEVFVLDMGDPVYIKDLACDLIRLSGLEPDHDIDVVFTGLRPGEKLFEELFSDREAHTRTQHEKVFVSQNGRGHEADQASCLDAAVDELIAAAQRGDADEVRRLFRTLVPEYRMEMT